MPGEPVSSLVRMLWSRQWADTALLRISRPGGLPAIQSTPLILVLPAAAADDC